LRGPTCGARQAFNCYMTQSKSSTQEDSSQAVAVRVFKWCLRYSTVPIISHASLLTNGRGHRVSPSARGGGSVCAIHPWQGALCRHKNALVHACRRRIHGALSNRCIGALRGSTRQRGRACRYVGPSQVKCWRHRLSLTGHVQLHTHHSSLRHTRNK
jgi:hypothetical protein